MGLSNISGTITAIVTPFTKKGNVDFKQLENLIEFQIENGVQGIVVCGSTGESATLKLKEKQEIIIKSVEISAGRLPVIAATGTYETEQSIELSKFAQDNGSDAVLIVAPYYLNRRGWTFYAL
jgi:4-hydroxy-tetrahydrodipicolinate synthase